VINTTYMIHHKSPLLIGEEYWKLREKVISQEHIVLSTLAFYVTVELPYKYLLNYLKTLHAKHSLAQTSWNILNDSFCTMVCLQYKPHVIAVASIFLASRMLKMELPQIKKAWWEVFDTSMEQIEDIANQVLNLYDNQVDS